MWRDCNALPHAAAVCVNACLYGVGLAYRQLTLNWPGHSAATAWALRAIAVNKGIVCLLIPVYVLVFLSNRRAQAHTRFRRCRREHAFG